MKLSLKELVLFLPLLLGGVGLLGGIGSSLLIRDGFVASVALLMSTLLLAAALVWEWRRGVRTRVLLVGTQEQASGILEQFPDALVVYDRNQRVLLFNRAAENLFGIARTEVLGKVVRPELVATYPALTLFLKTLFSSLAPKVKRISASYPEVLEVEFGEPKPLSLLVTTLPLRAPGGGEIGFVKVVRDVTREHEISRMKSEFISIAAHQLRTPLAAIRWTLALLTRGDLGVLSPQAQRAVQDGLVVSEKLIKLVNEFLDVSRIEEGKFGYQFVPGDVAALAQKTISEFQTLAQERKVALTLTPPASPLPPVPFDSERLAMALANLLDNAVRYNQPGGQVQVYVAAQGSGPFVEIRIEDTGMGIPRGELPKLFTKFFRGSKSMKVETEGSGLGLFIAKNIIERHGGRIQLDSEEGSGTRVVVTLPTDSKLIPKEEPAA